MRQDEALIPFADEVSVCPTLRRGIITLTKQEQDVGGAGQAEAARYFDRFKKARFGNRFHSSELFDWNRIFEDVAGSFANPSRPVKKHPKRKR